MDRGNRHNGSIERFVLPRYKRPQISVSLTRVDLLDYIDSFEPTLKMSLDRIVALRADPTIEKKDYGKKRRFFERTIEYFRDMGIEIRLRGSNGQNHYWVMGTLGSASGWLERATGIWPYPTPSDLSATDQRRVLAHHDELLQKKGSWPAELMTDKELRAEILRILIPYMVQQAMETQNGDVFYLNRITRRHFREHGLSDILEWHYKNNVREVLPLAYTWLNRRDMERFVPRKPRFDHDHPDIRRMRRNYLRQMRKIGRNGNGTAALMEHIATESITEPTPKQPDKQ